MNQEANNKSWLSRAPNWLIAIIMIALVLLYLTGAYWKLFSSMNWREQYFDGESILSLLSNPEAHTEPLIGLGVCIIVGVAVYWLKGSDE